MFGEDTFTRVTILDEDFPGKIGFDETEIECPIVHKKVEILI